MITVEQHLTEAARFRDPRSYVGTRIHPGTRHYCQYLYGADASKVREAVRKEAAGNCHYCGKFCWEAGELHHKQGGLGLKRCWCEENLVWACRQCHREEHGR